LELQELDSWVALDQGQADLGEAVVKAVEVVAVVAFAGESRAVAVGVAQHSEVQAEVLGVGNFLAGRQIRQACRPRFVVPYSSRGMEVGASFRPRV
jgi:hypothetical protein